MNNYSTLDIYNQYFARSILLVLAVISILYILKNRDKKEKYCIICVIGCYCLIFFNELIYRIIAQMGEAKTYYRLLWIFPTVLLAAYLLVQILSEEMNKWKRAVIVVLLLIAGGMYSNFSISDWVSLPDNIYQLNQETIDMANLIREIKGDGLATYVDDGSLSYTIRQYDADIGFTELDKEYINQFLTVKATFYRGKTIREYINYNHSEFIAIRKEDVEIWLLMHTGGIKRVGETKNYYLYRVDYNEMADYFEEINAIEEKYDEITYANTEYVSISGMKEYHEFLYVSDLYELETIEIAEQVVALANERQVEAVLINASTDEVAKNERVQTILGKLDMPYIYNDKAMQVLEYNDFSFVFLNNEAYDAGAGNELQQFLSTEKNVVAFATEHYTQAVAGEKTWKELLSDENKANIMEVITGDREIYYRAYIDKDIVHYSTSPIESGMITLLRVKGLEDN